MALNFYAALSLNGTAMQYELDKLKLNGRLIHSLGDVDAPGRLEFVAVTGSGRQSTGGFPTVLRVNRNAEKLNPPGVDAFKSMRGMRTTMEIGDHRDPRNRLTVTGRVMSAVTKIDSFAIKQRVVEASVDIEKPQNRRVVFVPAEKN
jgi:hypothetical protein